MATKAEQACKWMTADTEQKQTNDDDTICEDNRRYSGLLDEEV